jgi:hypothetical protein
MNNIIDLQSQYINNQFQTNMELYCNNNSVITHLYYRGDIFKIEEIREDFNNDSYIVKLSLNGNPLEQHHSHIVNGIYNQSVFRIPRELTIRNVQ